MSATDLKHTDLISLLENRRSYYTLNSNSPIPDPQIKSILEKILLTVPSAFNTQSTRLVLALGPSHEQIWQTCAKLLREHMGEERWASATTSQRIDGFRRAHGTVLFYEDYKDVAAKREQFKSYAGYFDGWTEHTSGMHQLATWTALEAEGFGANLQHYNGVIDDEVAKMFEVPEDWKLKAQLVFGGIEGARPDPKEKKDVNVQLKVFGL